MWLERAAFQFVARGQQPFAQVALEVEQGLRHLAWRQVQQAVLPARQAIQVQGEAERLEAVGQRLQRFHLPTGLGTEEGDGHVQVFGGHRLAVERMLGAPFGDVAGQLRAAGDGEEQAQRRSAHGEPRRA
ncbi:hypothetical protein D3C81_1724250 [compost metagenome]